MCYAIACLYLSLHIYRLRLAQLSRHGPACLPWVVRKLRINVTRLSLPLFTEGTQNDVSLLLEKPGDFWIRY